MGKATALVLIALTFVATAVVDLLLLPARHLETSLYAIPVLIAAQQLSPRGVTVITGLAIAADLVDAYLEQAPPTIWPFGTLALLVVGTLAALLAEQRRKTARRAQEAGEARERLQQFLGMVAHDLRSPLTTIFARAQLARRALDSQRPETAPPSLLAIEDAARQMQRLIDDLLDASRIGAGRFEIRPAPMDLVALVRRLLEQQQAATTAHRLSLEAPERLQGTWDQQRVGQLFANLISNAVKYSPGGGEVRIGVNRAPGVVVVRVADQGVGISPEEMNLLFQPFSRLDGHRAMRGTGLGLYIARGIAEAHGGRIWVESEPGKGSTFFVALPAEDR